MEGSDDEDVLLEVSFIMKNVNFVVHFCESSLSILF